MTVPPWRPAVSTMSRNSFALPKTGSMRVEMRSKLPSVLGVCVHPDRPPEAFTGPVCTAVMPMVSNAAHISSSPSVARNDRPGRPMRELG